MALVRPDFSVAPAMQDLEMQDLAMQDLEMQDLEMQETWKCKRLENARLGKSVSS
jgi:hypothetical protein